MTLSELSQSLSGAPLNVYLLGVAGSGMSGIAALLLALGHRTSGTDRVDTLETDRLRKKGLDFHLPYVSGAIADADLVIYSSAIKPGNAAYDEARQLGKPMFRRADALSAIMSAKKGIVICGTHGKTTTSALTAHVLRNGGWKPSHYVGAEIPILGTNARWDSEGEYFVAEGDESDGTLINYHPEHAIVLNIEPEHLDFYRDLDAIDSVFSRLVSQTAGRVVYCGDDVGASRVCAAHPGAVSYGFSAACRYRPHAMTSSPQGSSFKVVRDSECLGEVELNIPGLHNASNALAVIALALEMGMPFEAIASALPSFRGARRRFEVKYDEAELLIVDDYGHHPTEIAATLATARGAGRSRVVTLFQPHRYSRTQALRSQFGGAFGDTDILLVSDIYPAGEEPIPGVSGQWIADAAAENGHAAARFIPELRRLREEAARLAREGDLILTLGAGNIHECGGAVADDWRTRARIREVMGAGIVRLYEPLKNHTTLKVGGPAQFWVEPETEEGFAELVRWCSDEGIPFMVMGRGSNLLVREGGIRGVVAHLTRGEFAKISVSGLEITAGVGVKLKQIAAAAQQAGIGGFEWMEGIPGNLGGGLRMNAGAMGSQTFDQVIRVRMADHDGNIFSKTPAELEVRYRDVPTLKTNFAISSVLRGEPAEKESIHAKLDASQKKRKESQPIAASAGCIFKNPSEVPAGRLVEEMGFKNFRVGRARVSEVHGNFIVNDGGATADEVLALIGEIQAAAERLRGIRLETEVQIVGEDL